MSKIIRGKSLQGSRIVRAHVLSQSGEAMKALIEVNALRAQAINAAGVEATRISTSIARRIVAEELELHPERIASIVAAAISKVKRATLLAVRVSPSDLDRVRDAEADILRRTGLSVPMTVESDPTLLPGDCVVESNLGTVNARVAAQLDEFERALDVAGRSDPP